MVLGSRVSERTCGIAFHFSRANAHSGEYLDVPSRYLKITIITFITYLAYLCGKKPPTAAIYLNGNSDWIRRPCQDAKIINNTL